MCAGENLFKIVMPDNFIIATKKAAFRLRRLYFVYLAQERNDRALYTSKYYICIIRHKASTHLTASP